LFQGQSKYRLFDKEKLMHSINAHSMNYAAPGSNGQNGIGDAYSPIVMNSHTSPTWDEVRSRIESDDEGKWDALVHRDDLMMREGKIIVPSAIASDYASALHPTRWATSQFCNRLRIPTAYFRRCPKELQDQQFNCWVRRADVGGDFEEGEYSHRDGAGNSGSHSYSSPSRWLLRVKDDQLRGVLSDRYSKLDNKPFLETLEPLLPSRLQAEWFALTDESMHLRLVDPTLSREVLKDDRIMVGLHISNSEVGKKSICLDAIVYRLVCKNGLIRLVKGKSLMQQKHVALSSFQMKRNLEKAVGEALTTAAGLLEKVAQATETAVPDVEGIIEQLGVLWNLSEAFEGRIKDALLREPAQQQDKLYGLVNAVTQAAQSLSPDERYDMEVRAGSLMDSGFVLLPNARARRRRSGAMPIGIPANGNVTTNPAENNGEVAETRSNGVFQQARQMFGGQVVASSKAAVSPVAIPAASQSPASQPVAMNDVPRVGDVSRMGGTSRFAQVRNGGALPDAVAQRRVAPPTNNDAESKPLATANPAFNEPAPEIKSVSRSDEPATGTQWDVIWAIADKRGVTRWDMDYLLQEHFDADDAGMLTKAEAQQLMQMLQQKPLSELQAPEPDEEPLDEPSEENEF
jgi:hypothetical protein